MLASALVPSPGNGLRARSPVSFEFKKVRRKNIPQDFVRHWRFDGRTTLIPRDHPIYALEAELLRVLGHPTRVRILELLKDGELSVGELQAALALDSSGTSQHVGVLRKQGLLESRRQGTSVFYRVRDPRIFQLLAVARQILTSNLVDAHSLLEGLHDEAPPSDAAGVASAPPAEKRRSALECDADDLGAQVAEAPHDAE
jgi:ArsR family transcriptional regulator